MRLIFIVLICFVQILGRSGINGSITGNVTDKKSGAAIKAACVEVKGTALRVFTDSNGHYNICAVPVGQHEITASYRGYKNAAAANVMVKEGLTITLNFSLERAAKITGKPIRGRNTTRNGALYLTEDAGKDWYTGSSATAYEKREPACTPNWNTEEYSRINENGFFDVLSRPLSTFAADVDAASYSNCRRFLSGNQLPYKDAVRVEEFINYFDYEYRYPNDDKPLAVNLDFADCPWNTSHKLISIGLQGRDIPKNEQKPSSLVFLLDISGSMHDPAKLPLVKMAFKLLVDRLTPNDKVAIVVYASNTAVILPMAYGSEKRKIIDAIDSLEAGGSTAGGAGIELAYSTASKNFIKGGNNRVILATDGDFNVGISSTSELVRYVETKRKEGIFLTILGFGMGNYKDGRLEELADKGNGNHFYIDNILEAKKVFVNQLTSTLFTIAKDVKIQVEFNPAKIKSYRLIGYENRKLEDRDFSDDKKDAGEMGAGHRVTALYEIELAGQNNTTDSGLKYQTTKIKNSAYSTNEYLTVRIRYKHPDEDKSLELSETLKSAPLPIDKAGENIVFASAVAQFAMLLRDSEFKGSSSFSSVLQMARASKGSDPNGYRAEFITLVERAELLTKR